MGVAAVGWCVPCVDGAPGEDRMLKVDLPISLHL